MVSGEMEVDFYDGDGSLFRSETLLPGEALLQIRGGHGFRFPASSQVLELKIGPYLGLIRIRAHRPDGCKVVTLQVQGAIPKIIHRRVSWQTPGGTWQLLLL